MITYLYWFSVILVVCAIFYGLGVKLELWKPAMISAVSVLLIGMLAYYFHFQQIFVKRYGGVMTVAVPKGQRHITSTWKDDNLWIENYDPVSNICYFYEYSRGNLLQGKVTIQNCNPLNVSAGAPAQPVISDVPKNKPN